MKKVLNEIFDYTEYRKNIVNLLWFLFCIVGILVLPSIFGYLFTFIIKDKTLCSLLGSIFFCIIIFLIYLKDLKKEFKLFNDNLSKDIKKMIKYYVLGVLLMITFNILLYRVLNGTSQNEELVREMLFNRMGIMLINIVLVAPITEEIVYRKSVNTVFKSKWTFAIISAILFGSAHIMTNVFSGTFIWNDLFYILPYGSYGFAFALMDYNTKTTFSSIMMHSFHNLINAMLLINLHFIGVL